MNNRINALIIGLQVCLLGLAAIIGYGFAQVQTWFETPSCPEEDSCIADYDGESDSWKIIEVTP